jgi:hypothetical protein
LTHWCGPTDGQYAASKFSSIQRTDGEFRKTVFLKFDEAKSARLARRAILYEFHTSDPEALCYEPFRQCVFVFTKRDVAYEQSIQIAPPVGGTISEYDNAQRKGIQCSLRGM